MVDVPRMVTCTFAEDMFCGVYRHPGAGFGAHHCEPLFINQQVGNKTSTDSNPDIEAAIKAPFLGRHRGKVP